ncbi:hypothetical protein P154DRAFT_624180 [Amniculicola lignicola CBS 123094]|uniref:Uncharacterized protein n=1 Tax=Amniculicola lignicola CBS 123094 TaxID=1392246 RepID=A0A6A5W2E0_9PLEO|nr:hypothetical protein P154DRAFT_624180 [Amniculicola lignicola CBS 123094]
MTSERKPFLFGEWLHSVSGMPVFDLEQNATWSYSIFTTGYTRTMHLSLSFSNGNYQSNAILPMHVLSVNLWQSKYTAMRKYVNAFIYNDKNTVTLRMDTWQPKTSAGDWISASPGIPYSILGVFAKVVSNSTNAYRTLDLARTNPDEFFQNGTGINVLACGIEALWEPSEYYLKEVSNVPVISAETRSSPNQYHHALITIEENWARTVFSPTKVDLSLATPYFDFRNKDKFTDDVVPMVLETLIAAVFAEGISNWVGDSSLNSEYEIVCPVDFDRADNKCNRYQFSLSVFGTALGNWRGAKTAEVLPVILSMITLLLYSAFVIVKMMNFSGYGRAITTWDTSAELVALALQSDPPAHLKNTAVGIERNATYQEPVGVRVNTVTDRLEMVFKNDEMRHRKKFRKIRVDKAY